MWVHVQLYEFQTWKQHVSDSQNQCNLRLRFNDNLNIAKIERF